MEQTVALTGGKTAVIKKLSALDLFQATSYCGDKPSDILVNAVTAVCSIVKLDGKPVQPCRSKADFQGLSALLDSDDVMLLGIEVGKLSSLSEEQKNYLTAVALAVTSGASLPEPPSPESPSGSSAEAPLTS